MPVRIEMEMIDRSKDTDAKSKQPRPRLQVRVVPKERRLEKKKPSYLAEVKVPGPG